MKQMKRKQLVLMGAVVMGVILLLACGAKDPLSPDDGTPAGTIFYVRNDTINGYGIYSMDADGSNQRRIFDTEDDEMIPNCACDGQRFAFVWEKDLLKQIYTMNTDGTDPQRLTDDTLDQFCPRWSPDDSRIAFHRAMGIGNTDIYVYDIEHDTLIEITADPKMDISPSWSPDGRWIVFASNRDGDYEIYRVELGTGADPVNLTNDTVQNESPRYSHDGEWIVYISKDRENIAESDMEVFKMRPDGSDVTQLTQNTWNDFSPCWSPDDAWVAFRSAVPGPARFDICRIRADGTDFTNITDNMENDAWPDWGM